MRGKARQIRDPSSTNERLIGLSRWTFRGHILGDQSSLPIVNSKMYGSSPGNGLYGKPHSKRRGPIGENQRKPKPQLARNVESGNTLRHGSTEMSAFAGLRRQYWFSRLYVLPTSLKTTPRMP